LTQRGPGTFGDLPDDLAASSAGNLPLSVVRLKQCALAAYLTTCCRIDITMRMPYLNPMIQARPADTKNKSRLCEALTGLVIDVFRLNGDLLASGDALVGDLGLTSARWQVLGAIALSPVPLPVAHLARNMGLTRQAVQRSMDEMREDGFVRLDPNPYHRRAMLVTMTERGEATYRAASERQERWADALATDLSPESIEAAGILLRELQRRLNATAVLPLVEKEGT
jgi:DNA-binding MarR family transcriptional regulator